jgi:uncharacterized repeat protein (TIGR01451 family)
MLISSPRYRSRFSIHHLRPLLAMAILIGGSGWRISPTLAQSAPPGLIKNTATGSFIDELDLTNTAIPIESNTVQVTVVEVAGITVTDGGSSGSTVTGGIVYFDFVLTNVGNDITQFFIPGVPSTIVGGTQAGDIKILTYDSDGSGANPAVALNVTVPSSGGNTGTLLSGVATANNGVIPVGGTIRIRVPITITATSGNVDVKMGDTTSTNGQNEAYLSGNKDIYTADNLDTVAGETAGVPASGEREASLTQSLPISITTNTTNAPTLTCSSDRRIFNSAYNGNGGVSTTGTDAYWDSAIGTASGPPPTSGWIDAYRTGNRAQGAWVDSPYGDAGWISHFANTDQTPTGNSNIDIYFRYQFNLDPTVDVNSFQVAMDFFGDNAIADIFINGISQKSNYPTVLPQPIGGGNPYQFEGYRGAGKAALTLVNNWQTGSNEIIIQVKSGAPLVGLVAQNVPSYLCKSDAGDAPISYGTAPHAILTNPKVYLGSIPPDADPFAGQPSPSANGDNTNGTNDEDGITTALKVPISGTYNLSVPVHNTSGGSATLHAWIDFNKNLKFEPGEYQSIAVGNSATTANLSWTVPSGTTIGSSYARFRLTTTSLTDNADPGVDERSTINANDGEVEDYSIDLVGNPNLLLVKRITAINGLPQKRNGDSLANYENEAANLYDDNDNATPIAPNLHPTTNKWPLIPNTTNPALIGAIDGGTIKPNDSIEYTIYFLSTGDIPAKSVLFCDRVPENVTFIPTAFNSLEAGTGGLAGADRGIAVNLSGTVKSYTNVGNDDFARYFPPGIEPNTVFPKVNCGGSNANGAVVVNFGDIPNATTNSTPGSYGFVRFQGQVK